MIYRIQLSYESNMKGIITYWEETADSEAYMHMKLNRVLDYWLNIICPYIKVDDMPQTKSLNKLINDKYRLILCGINILNSCNTDSDLERNFEITAQVGENMFNLKEMLVFEE
jgi:hypothetical protein